MKKLYPFKIKISIWTWLVWVVLCWLGAAKWAMFCYGLMFLHELSHSFIAMFNGCTVYQISVYPFGFCAEMAGVKQLSPFKKILVYLAGPFSHFVVQILIVFLFGHHEISWVMEQYLTQINLNYFLFNLIPVYPLDGYHIVEALLEFVCTDKCFWAMQMISFVALMVFAQKCIYRTAVFRLCVLLLFFMNLVHVLKMSDVLREELILKAFHKMTEQR